MGPECDGDTNCKWHTLYRFDVTVQYVNHYATGNLHAIYSNQKIDKEFGRLGNKKTSVDYPNDSIIKIGQNSEESSGDLRKLAVTQTPGINHPQTLL